jgi:hypothetical protein
MAQMMGGQQGGSDGMMQMLESLPMGMGGGMGLFADSQKQQDPNSPKTQQPKQAGK